MPIWLVFFIMATIFAGALNAMLAFYTWRHREAPGASPFMALLLLITLWSALAALQVMLDEHFRIFRNLSYVCIAGSPVAMLMFAVQYNGLGRWLKPWRMLGFCVIPLLTQLIIWMPTLRPLWLVNESARGPWFWIHSIYSYSLVFICYTLLAVTMLRASVQRRRQLAIILLGLGVPIVVNVLFTFSIIPYVGVDWSPLSFTVSGVAIAWSLYRYRLFDLAPLAREKVTDEMRDGMLVLNPQHEIQDLNPMACDILDRPAKTLVGQPLTRLPEIWLSLAPLITRPIPRADAVELELKDRQDVLHAYEVRVTPLHGLDVSLVGYLILFHDITERKAHEREVARYLQELEARNAELDAFAHTVAHDLKTPLTALVGFGRLLRQRAARWSPEQIAETTERLVRTGDKMTNIINELLLLANVRKSEAGERVPLDMDMILHEVDERLAEMLTEYDAALVLDTPVQTWPVAVGHAPWVEAVWANYVSNALKYGGCPPEVTLGATILDSKIQNPESKILFWVRDNGPGLAPEQQAQLFTPFTRLHQERAEGHGLGLSIVQRIVTKLGGEVGVSSAVGQGATFWFTLPAAQTEGEE